MRFRWATFGPVLLASLAILGSVWPSNGSGQESEDDDWKEFDHAVTRDPDWDLLYYSREESKYGKITKLKIVLEKTGRLPMDKLSERDKEFVYETKDPKILALTESFLGSSTRCVAFSYGQA